MQSHVLLLECTTRKEAQPIFIAEGKFLDTIKTVSNLFFHFKDFPRAHERIDSMKTIVFAGGCFWGVEAYFKLIDGVTNTQVGYANGHKDNPTYEEVCQHATGHAEACQITYDPSRITLAALLTAFWRIVDPTVLNRQGHDVGDQYRTGIYYEDTGEFKIIKSSLQEEQKKYKKVIVTQVEPLIRFWDAETMHQDYLDKHPNGYCHIPIAALKKEFKKAK